MVVNDVHIRYEDSEADPSHPFAVGLLLERFSAQSTDKYWVSVLLYVAMSPHPNGSLVVSYTF